MNPLLVSFDISAVTPEHDQPPADRVVSGSPRFTTWNVDESGDGRRFAGVWEATPGTWRIAYDEWEFCSIISGVSVISDDDGGSVTVRAGDAFVLRPGFTGTWEVVETTRKQYVIDLPQK
ncbi:cupin domain-containing protein [Microbaculum marinum]|uniref:Cupin domain-containing protein n=1 Tax=Microbaculum marinum TaxID=1764581 RepID=A0AAW9RX73_9HYPH